MPTTPCTRTQARALLAGAIAGIALIIVGVVLVETGSSGSEDARGEA